MGAPLLLHTESTAVIRQKGTTSKRKLTFLYHYRRASKAQTAHLGGLKNVFLLEGAGIAITTTEFHGKELVKETTLGSDHEESTPT